MDVDGGVGLFLRDGMGWTGLGTQKTNIRYTDVEWNGLFVFFTSVPRHSGDNLRLLPCPSLPPTPSLSSRLTDWVFKNEPFARRDRVINSSTPSTTLGIFFANDDDDDDVTTLFSSHFTFSTSTTTSISTVTKKLPSTDSLFSFIHPRTHTRTHTRTL